MEFNNFGKSLVKKAVKISTEKSIEFGKEEKKCYRAQVILVNEHPYFGVNKCWKYQKAGKYKPSKQSFYLSQPAWVRFIEEVLPQLTYKPTEAVDSTQASEAKVVEATDLKHGVKRHHEELHDDEQPNTDGGTGSTTTIAINQLDTVDRFEPDIKIANWQ